jgi:hypothetical protein
MVEKAPVMSMKSCFPLRWQHRHRTARWLALGGVIALLSANPAHADINVILLRGWFGVFSTGLDKIAEQLNAAKGVHAEVSGHLSWRAAAEGIVRERAAGKTDAIVLVGHSQGGNNVVDMARVLETKNVPVALLITLAPFKQDPVPGNVLRAINYYQSGGWGDPLTPAANFKGKLSNIDVKEDASVTHINIDKSDRVRADISREVAAIAKVK